MSIETLRDLLRFIKENKIHSHMLLIGRGDFSLYGGLEFPAEIVAIKKDYCIISGSVVPLSSISEIRIKDPLPQVLISESAIKQKDN